MLPKREGSRSRGAKCPLTRPNITLRSFNFFSDSRSINIWSLRDRRPQRPKNNRLIRCDSFRDTTLILNWLFDRLTLFAQNAMENFSDRGLWQTFSELNLARYLELRQSGLTVLDEFLGCCGCAAPEHYACFDRFAPVRIRDPDHSGLHHRRVRVEHAFNFGRIDIE